MMRLTKIIFFVSPVNSPAPIQNANGPEYIIHIIGGKLFIELKFKHIPHQEKNTGGSNQGADRIIHQCPPQSYLLPFLFFIIFNHVYSFQYRQIITFLLICPDKCYREQITHWHRNPILNGSFPFGHFLTHSYHFLVKKFTGSLHYFNQQYRAIRPYFKPGF